MALLWFLPISNCVKITTAHSPGKREMCRTEPGGAARLLAEGNLQ